MVSMGMLGFVYLVLILGWIFIVLLLKCKKTLTNFNNTLYADGLEAEHNDRQQQHRQQQHCPSVHVIQLQAEDLENEEQFISNNNNNNNHSFYSQQQQQQLNSYPRRCLQCNNWPLTYPTDAIVNDNAAYTHDDDDDDTNNTPPPSYEEVMRRPEIYLKMHSTSNKKLTTEATSATVTAVTSTEAIS